MLECPAAVKITAQQEQKFYDHFYAQHLKFPDQALRCDRAHMLGYLADPAHPLYMSASTSTEVRFNACWPCRSKAVPCSTMAAAPATGECCWRPRGRG